MINEEIISYIKNAKEHGLSLDQIRINLKTGGWNDADISEAFTVTERSMAAGMIAPRPQLAPQSTVLPNQGEDMTSFQPNVSLANTGFVSATPYTMPAMPKKKTHIALIITLVIIFLLLGGTAFAFYKKIIPLPSFVTKYLDKPPYDEQNLISGLIFKMAQIKTAKYSSSGEISIGPRDPDAKPLILTGDLEPMSFDQTEYFPTEFKINLRTTTEMDFSNLNNSDWSFNFDTSGDFGDLYYQINIDALQKGKNLYFKINNLPTLFPIIQIPKSQWFLLDFDSIDEIAKQHLTEEEYAEYQNNTNSDKAEFEKNLTEYKVMYEEERAKLMRTLQKLVLMADEQKVLMFKEPPLKDTTAASPLYRYNLAFRPGTLATLNKTFYRDVVIPEYEQERAENEQFVKDLDTENMQAVMKYIEENTSILLWVDQNGVPESMKIKFRFVPGDVNANFNNKQINIGVDMKLISVNQPLNIEAPANAKSFFQYIFDSLEVAQIKSTNAKIMSNLSTVRAEAELYFDNKGNYGAKTSGGCVVSGTIFSTPRVANLLAEIKNIQIQEKLESKTACFSSKDAYAISAPLLDIGDGQKYFCVDSTGAPRETRSHAITTVCPSF